LQDSAARPISVSELARLSEISTRLAELNTRLRTELADSRQSSLELASSLETSTRGLEALRLELEASQRSSSELVARAESSERDLSALREALTRADSSLKSLESSFGEYRKTAETRILALQAERALWWILTGAGCIAAILALAIR
jgi:predicted  nucleic acid-binding Zn-ribbon protein